jgi:hypothetical protein
MDVICDLSGNRHRALSIEKTRTGIGISPNEIESTIVIWHGPTPLNTNVLTE